MFGKFLEFKQYILLKVNYSLFLLFNQREHLQLANVMVVYFVSFKQIVWFQV